MTSCYSRYITLLLRFA